METRGRQPLPPPSIDAVRASLTHLLLSGACPPRLAASLHRRIQADPAWAAYYSALRRLERTLADAPFSGAQTALVEQLVLQRLDAMGAIEASTRAVRADEKTGARGRSGLGAGSWPALAATACMIAFVVTSRPTSPVDGAPPVGDDDTTFNARGTAEGTPRYGLRVRCVDRSARRVIATAEAAPRGPSTSLACGATDADAVLAFSFTNLEQEAVHAYAIGVTTTGALRFLPPFGEEAGSVAIPGGTVDRALDVAASARGLSSDGPLSIFALFSDRPLRGADVARALRDAEARGMPVRALDRLPIGAWTARVELVEQPTHSDGGEPR
jgi:hypothetical protein